MIFNDFCMSKCERRECAWRLQCSFAVKLKCVGGCVYHQDQVDTGLSRHQVLAWETTLSCKYILVSMPGDYNKLLSQE
jgi:hypothetical protein